MSGWCRFCGEECDESNAEVETCCEEHQTWTCHSCASDCSVCGGSGGGSEPETRCRRCGGTGKVRPQSEIDEEYLRADYEMDRAKD